jgi:hypothetical protein
MFSGAQVSPFPISGSLAGTIPDVFDRFAHLRRRAAFQARKRGRGTLNRCVILSLDRFRPEEACSRTKA